METSELEMCLHPVLWIEYKHMSNIIILNILFS
jgi:hypothetical protein